MKVVLFALFPWSDLLLDSLLNVSSVFNVKPRQITARLFPAGTIISVYLMTRTGSAPSPVANRGVYPPSTTSASSEEFSRVSTPPTEISDALSSPTFAPPPNPQELARRRAQSDMASAEIGKRMLRGWAMLAEECPNDSCYGVPLVRPPMAGGGKDPRKVSRYLYYYNF
jgi:Sjogren's syndrome/scleroderma autoantigen 1 (Autoantigen p27)